MIFSKILWYFPTLLTGCCCLWHEGWLRRKTQWLCFRRDDTASVSVWHCLSCFLSHRSLLLVTKCPGLLRRRTRRRLYFRLHDDFTALWHSPDQSVGIWQQAAVHRVLIPTFVCLRLCLCSIPVYSSAFCNCSASELPSVWNWNYCPAFWDISEGIRKIWMCVKIFRRSWQNFVELWTLYVLIALFVYQEIVYIANMTSVCSDTDAASLMLNDVRLVCSQMILSEFRPVSYLLDRRNFTFCGWVCYYPRWWADFSPSKSATL